MTDIDLIKLLNVLDLSKYALTQDKKGLYKIINRENNHIICSSTSEKVIYKALLVLGGK